MQRWQSLQYMTSFVLSETILAIHVTSRLS